MPAPPAPARILARLLPALAALAGCAVGDRARGAGLQAAGSPAPGGLTDGADAAAVAERGTAPGCAPTHRGIEVCDGLDNDCDGETDDHLDLEAVGLVGGRCGAPVGECGFGVQECLAGALACVPEVRPAPEACDGLDNDCDGETDEAEDLRESGEVGDRCGTEGGHCRRGVVRCRGGELVCDGAVDPEPEGCNGLDDDCDGAVDEVEDLVAVGVVGMPCGSGEGACRSGVVACENAALVCVGAVQAAAETCDGQDNDCDGATDEFDDMAMAGIAGGRCGTDVGECGYGIAVCEQGAMVCDGETRPAPERCDGADNDCDGDVDEDFADLGDRCGTGACRGGQVVCDADDPDGLLTRCSTAGQASAERCNGLDDDCDSEADEDDDLAAAGVIGVPCGTDEGECRAGVTRCLRGGTLVCADEAGPLGEVCDGLDNDCDGQTDEGVRQCRDGRAFCDPAQPEPEVCDGVDNDCDGEVDEDDPALGRDCVREEGNCRRAGVRTCVGGSLVCGPAGGDDGCLPVGEEREPNNTGDTCNPVRTGGHRVTGAVSRQGDRDWFCFEARAGQVVELDVDARVAGSPLDSYLYLWKLEPRRELARNDDAGAGNLDSFIRWTFDSEGRYAVEVAGFSDRGCAACAYTLTLR